MITIIYLASLASLAHSGLVSHDLGGGEDDHHKATSYQNIHMEHFHAVPTYVKKEYKHLLEHPISVGKSSSKVEIHHGGKHDHGYAIVDTKNNARGSGSGDEEGAFGSHQFGGHEQGGDEGASLGGHEGASLGGHEAALSQGYQVHDQHQELLQNQGGAGLGHGHYQAAFAPEDHQNYEAALAALHSQNGFGGHGHS